MAEADSQERQNQVVSIDGKEYSVDQLSETARNQVVNLRVTDQEIARLKQQLAIYQTARTAYAQALKTELPEDASGEVEATPKAH